MKEIDKCALCGNIPLSVIRGTRRLEADITCPNLNCTNKVVQRCGSDRSFISIRNGMYYATVEWNKLQRELLEMKKGEKNEETKNTETKTLSISRCDH